MSGPPLDSFSQIRVAGCPEDLSMEVKVTHMDQFGWLVRTSRSRGRDRTFVIFFMMLSTSVYNSHLMQFSPNSLRWQKVVAIWLRDCLLIRTSTAAVATAAAMLAMSSNIVGPQPGLRAPLLPSGAHGGRPC